MKYTPLSFTVYCVYTHIESLAHSYFVEIMQVVPTYGTLQKKVNVLRATDGYMSG